MNGRPLWPEDGVKYELAMIRAQVEYDEWVNSRKGKSGIRIYSRGELDNENNR